MKSEGNLVLNAGADPQLDAAIELMLKNQGFESYPPSSLILSSPPRVPAVAYQTLGTGLQWRRPEPILPFTQFTLDNGLTVIVREDHKMPIASVAVI